MKTKLGNRRIVIGGEVDCVRGTLGIRTVLSRTVLNGGTGKYTGDTTNFVELKTSLTIRGSFDEAKFEK